MAERIKGLSISLDLDTLGVDRKLSSIKRSFRDFDSSMRTNMNNFRNSEKNTKNYQRTIDDLNKTIDNQTTNLGDLKKQYDEVVKSEGAHSKSAQQLRTEINKQADNINYYKHQLGNVTSEFNEFQRQQDIANSKWTKFGDGLINIGGKMSSVGGVAKSLGDSLTKYITAPAVAATSALVGISLVKGIDRLTGIDTAKAKLMALGHDGENVEKIMENALNSVKGTSFGLGEAASTAASAVAAGVEPGKELERYLKLSGDAAAVAGVDINEMGAIFNKVQTSNKIQMGEMNQLLDRGIPIVQMLAEQLGVSAEEVTELASKGEISSEDFLNAVENGFGGAAKVMGENSITAALANMWAALGRVGANFLDAGGKGGGFFSQLKPILGELTDMFSNFEGVAASWGEKLGAVFAQIIEKVREGVTWFNNLESSQKKMIGALALGVVAAGPVLAVFGRLAMAAGTLITAYGPLFVTLGKMWVNFGKVRAGAMAFGAAFPKLATFIGILTGPIGITIGVIAALGTAFVIAYNKSETFRNFIGNLKDRFMSAWQGAMEFKDKITGVFSGMFSMFKGDWLGGRTILQKLGMTPEQILGVENFVLGIQYKFHQLKQALSAAFSAIASFAQQTFQKILTFWQTDGQQFIQAMINAFNLAKSIIVPVVTVAFNTIVSIIKFAMPLALSIIKMVWENIKGVINGALNVIMGLVRVFTGLFTGDFSKMWEGVKQIFAGAIQVVWNGFQLLFYGRIIKGVGSLVRLFSGSIRSLWTNVVNFFKGMFTGATTQATNLFNRVISIGRNLNTGFNNIVRSMVQGVLNWFRNMFTNVTTTVGNIRSGVQRTFSAMRDFAVNSVVRLKEGAVNGFNTLKTRAGQLVSDLKDNVNQRFTDMVDGAKALPGKLGDAIANGASKAVDGVKTLGNKMVEKLGGVVNGVIDGLNSITSKIGISATIDRWNVPTFSTGTGSPSGKLTKNGKIAADTIAKVGDKGPGNGKGTRELVHYPNGKVGLYDNDATIFAPKGTTIFSNKETEAMLGQIPKFSTGTGSGLWGRIKEIAGKAIDYITNPKKIFDDLISAVGNKFGDLSGFAGNLIKGVWEKIKSGMLGWITDRFGEATVGKSQKWMNYRMTTPYSPNAPVPGYPTSFNGGRHYGIDYGTPTGVPITAPIAGTVTRMSDVGGGLVARLQLADKAVQYFMHMSSVKPGKVGVGESVGNSGNSGKWTTGPHVHWQHEDPSASYIQNRNTKNPLSTIKGHLKGGQILSDGLFNLHKGEYVINPNEPTEAMKLLAIVGKKLAGKSKQTKELPNVGYNNGNEEVINKLTEMIGNQQQQIEQMNEAIKVLLGIEDKTGFDPNKAQKSIDKYNNRRTIMT